MFWRWLTTDQWSALGTVTSAAIALLNLIVVVVLVRFNQKTIGLLAQQTKDTRAQAAVALQTVSQLDHERKVQNGRQLMRIIGRFADLNDQILVAEKVIDLEMFSAADYRTMKPADWHEISAIAIEFWPEGTEKIIILGRKLREIDIDLAVLSKPLRGEDIVSGTGHLTQLLGEARALLDEIHSAVLQSVTEQPPARTQA